MKVISILIIVCFSILPAEAKIKDVVINGSGKILELNSANKSAIFTLNSQLRTMATGFKIFKSTYLDASKKEAMKEEASFNQFALQKYVVHQLQLNEVYELSVADGKMNFSITKNGAVKKKTRELQENLIIGPSFVPFLQQHWGEVQSGKKVLAQLAVLEQMDTFTFEFEKVSATKEVVEGPVTVRMKANSSLISAFVRPVYIVVKPDGSRILEIRGHMLPKQKVGSRWEDFDGDAFFEDLKN